MLGVDLIGGLLLSTLLLYSVYATDDTLLVANVVFRHGDRAPASTYPKQKYNESIWPNGYGELTDVGKGQQYRLGVFLKERYVDLLDDKFNYKNIEVRSSDVDRCMISAYSNLAGLYSNHTTEENDLDLPYINWQPVPVHTVPVVMDQILALHRPCAKVTEEQAALFDSPPVRQVNEDYADFFTMVSNMTGANLTDNSFKNIWRIYDILNCESKHNITIPDWASETNISCADNAEIPCKDMSVFEILKEMEDFEFYIMYNSPILHRFDGGPLLEDISAKFNEYAMGTRTIQYNMYSGHDTTVAATLSALGVFDKKQPQYTATIMLELHRHPKGFEVKAWYKPVTDDANVVSLDMPECKSPCMLKSFTKMLAKYKISDWDTDCGNNPSPTDGTAGTMSSTKAFPTSTKPTPKPLPALTENEVIVISVCSSVVIMMALGAGMCWCKRRRNHASNYIPM